MVKHPEYKTDAAKILEQERIVGDIEILSKSKGRLYHFTALVTTAEQQLILRCSNCEADILKNFACLKKLSSLGITPVLLRCGNLNSIYYSFESFVEGESDADSLDERFVRKLGEAIRKIQAQKPPKLPLLEIRHLREKLPFVANALFQILPEEGRFFAHGDLTLGNLKYNPQNGTLYLIDFENALLGPQGYDIGHFLFCEGIPPGGALLFADACGIPASDILTCSILTGLQRTAKFLDEPKLWKPILKRTEEFYGWYLSTMRRSS